MPRGWTCVQTRLHAVGSSSSLSSLLSRSFGDPTLPGPCSLSTRLNKYQKSTPAAAMSTDLKRHQHFGAGSQREGYLWVATGCLLQRLAAIYNVNKSSTCLCVSVSNLTTGHGMQVACASAVRSRRCLSATLQRWQAHLQQRCWKSAAVTAAAGCRRTCCCQRVLHAWLSAVLHRRCKLRRSSAACEHR